MADSAVADSSLFSSDPMKVLVVGAGVFGAWSAKFLADGGHSVTLVDAYGPANDRASSGDHSRVIRAGYGPDAIYSRWATDAWADWLWLSEQSGEKLLTQTGALFLGEPGNEYVRDTYATLRAVGVSVERLDPPQLRKRFPALSIAGLAASLYEPRAGAIRARAAVQSFVSTLVHRERVVFSTGTITAVNEQRAECRVSTKAGVMEADAYVFACGAWLRKMFPQAIGDRIRPTRQEVLYFNLEGTSRDEASRLPVWIDFAAGLYSLPDFDGRGVKVGIDRHGPVVDPDTVARVVDPAQVDFARQLAGRRVPALRHAPLVEARVCQYENTSSGDFIIDRHPQWAHCWIVGGGSGHGFKHGPSVGRHVAALVSGETSVIPRFSLRGKSAEAARAVF